MTAAATDAPTGHVRLEATRPAFERMLDALDLGCTRRPETTNRTSPAVR